MKYEYLATKQFFIDVGAPTPPDGDDWELFLMTQDKGVTLLMWRRSTGEPTESVRMVSDG